MQPTVGAELASVPVRKNDLRHGFRPLQKAKAHWIWRRCNLVKVLANSYFGYVPDVVETLIPKPRQVQVLSSGVEVGLDRCG